MDGRTILVTGGAGFLGSHFVRLALGMGAAKLINVDALTYAGDLERLADLEGDSRYGFEQADISDRPSIARIFTTHRPQIVVHYAADSHVTRSEADPARFFRTNVDGTRTLIEEAIANGVQRFVHVSTDEVYGPILEGSFKEEDKLPGDQQASSAYAKSKSLADDLVRTFQSDMDVVVARPTNAFGQWQFPEKAFPRWVTRALQGEVLPVWGDGLYVRQWLFGEDFARAISLLANSAIAGEVYNVGPRHDPEITNLELARWLLERLKLSADRVDLTDYDRPDHDRRYAVDSAKIESLGWAPGDVWEQLDRTIDWYKANERWWRRHIVEAESIYTDSKR